MSNYKENTVEIEMGDDTTAPSVNDPERELHPPDQDTGPDLPTPNSSSDADLSPPEKPESEDTAHGNTGPPEENPKMAEVNDPEDPSGPESRVDANGAENTEVSEYQEDDSVELGEVHEESKSRLKIPITAGLLLVLISSGLYWGGSKWKRPGPQETHLKSTDVETVITPDTHKDPPEVTEPIPDSNRPTDRFNSKIAEIENLRDELLIKQGEIAELKRYYKKAIIQVADKILQLRGARGISTVQQALKDRAIELNLQTIQRRQVYIQSLDHPTRWLDNGSEELLYLKRRIKINLGLAQITSGIDLDGLIAECDEIITKRRQALSNLALDTDTATRQPLENIWNEIIENEKQYALNKIIPNENNRFKLDQENYRQKTNRIILEEICAGNYTRRNELTVLSVTAAKCLAQASDGDLFLNRISDLNPDAAKHLIQWKGNWICLNGIKDLTPEVAKHLSQWKGNWLSLNGIAELSFESSHYLRQWEGKQLELMGLDQRHMQFKPRVLALLSQWEKSGGKLYISEKMRQEIKKLDTL
jgi:hypothetical protein